MSDPPETGIANGCEAPRVSPGNRTQVLCKSRKPSLTGAPLQPPLLLKYEDNPDMGLKKRENWIGTTMGIFPGKDNEGQSDQEVSAGLELRLNEDEPHGAECGRKERKSRVVIEMRTFPDVCNPLR